MPSPGPSLKSQTAAPGTLNGSPSLDPYSKASIYYGPKNDPTKLSSSGGVRSRAYSINYAESSADVVAPLRRRGSQDQLLKPRQFYIQVDETLKKLLESEDTDNNFQITIDDEGPKVLTVGTANSLGYNKAEIRGTYMLSNLLQELTIAKKMGRHQIILDEARLNENPVARLSRLIQYQFWDSLTRRIDKDMIDIIAVDPKNRGEDSRPRIYVPHSEKEQYNYYSSIAMERPDLKLDVVYLPEKITPEWVKSINDTPGLLALDMDKVKDADGNVTLKGVPYVVPGGRFNEFYGWDSYMVALGLLVNDRVDLAQGMVKNFIYEIKFYGKILNANRSYYLCRSQPPFLTDMALRVYKRIKHTPDAKDFLREALYAAIKEYNTVWTCSPRLDPVTGLSRYRPDGLGIPPETEASHFEHLLLPYTKKYNLSFEEFTQNYNDGIIKEPELDKYFLHDRAVRESGHDTSYRLEGRCADLATIDLNSLLYKYEADISAAIRTEFNDHLVMPDGSVETSAKWDRLQRKRKAACDKYLWNEERGMFFDYDTNLQQQSDYESCTTLWSLYAGLATPAQAAKIVKNALPLFEMPGGLVAGTLKSRGEVGLDRPNRQWDYPYGWAPQQILAWIGLQRYGYETEAGRVIYKWLYMMTKAFVDFNGVVVEKYDVTQLSHPHMVDAEYGNQGADFKGVATEGFGWVNSSYVLGLSMISSKAKRALGTLTTPDNFIKSESEDF